MRTVWIILLLMFFGNCRLEAADISGKWDFSVQLDIGSGDPVFTFEQNGESLSGTYSGAAGSAPLKGTVKGNQVDFEFTIQMGQDIKVRYTGTIESDATMKGTADYGGQAKGAWTAKRSS